MGNWYKKIYNRTPKGKKKKEPIIVLEDENKKLQELVRELFLINKERKKLRKKIIKTLAPIFQRNEGKFGDYNKAELYFQYRKNGGWYIGADEELLNQMIELIEKDKVSSITIIEEVLEKGFVYEQGNLLQDNDSWMRNLRKRTDKILSSQRY